jgi:hypothetical protein
MKKRLGLTLPLLSIFFLAFSQKQATISNIKTINVDSGWANNSVNVTVFRKNSLVSFGDTQFISFYDKNKFVVVGKRNINSTNWILQRTNFKGNANDAHNIISIMVDGDGYLHVSWDHHNNKLHYAKSVSPGSLQLETASMTGLHEDKLSYPEFYRLKNGNLLFFYRDGGSGQGNLVINQYNLKTKSWQQLQNNLIDGQGQRNAYWQACIGENGFIHVSWVWRESPDVASNHDMCYAVSKDGGISWQKSTGEKYVLPITAATAEHACNIPQKRELINQTSMFADAKGNPYIATYWRDSASSIPQYHIVYLNGNGWQTRNLGFRKTAFSLSGAGTKKIPISRPQIIAWQNGKNLSAAIIFRDDELGGKVSMAVCDNIENPNWKLKNLTETSVVSWEPSYDTELWKNKKILHLFVQKAEQIDGEGTANIPPQMVQVIEWKP